MALITVRVVQDDEVAGSSPVTPTINLSVSLHHFWIIRRIASHFSQLALFN